MRFKVDENLPIEEFDLRVSLGSPAHLRVSPGSLGSPAPGWPFPPGSSDSIHNQRRGGQLVQEIEILI